MISYLAYQTAHFFGIAMVLVSLGALVFFQPGQTGTPLSKRMIAMTHGLGLLLVLVTGFGMLAKQGTHWPLPGWVGGKLLVWLGLGALMGLVPRLRASRAVVLWWSTIGLAATAAWLVFARPF